MAEADQISEEGRFLTEDTRATYDTVARQYADAIAGELEANLAVVERPDGLGARPHDKMPFVKVIRSQLPSARAA